MFIGARSAEKLFDEIVIFFCSDIDRNVFGFLSNAFWRGCQNCLLRVLRNISRFFSFLKNFLFYHFETLSNKPLAFLKVFLKNLSTALSNLPSTCLWEHFEEKQFSWDYYFFVRTLRENFWLFVEKLSTGLSKLPTKYVSIGTIKRERFFLICLSLLDIEPKISAFCQ